MFFVVQWNSMFALMELLSVRLHFLATLYVTIYKCMVFLFIFLLSMIQAITAFSKWTISNWALVYTTDKKKFTKKRSGWIRRMFNIQLTRSMFSIFDDVSCVDANVLLFWWSQILSNIQCLTFSICVKFGIANKWYKMSMMQSIFHWKISLIFNTKHLSCGISIKLRVSMRVSHRKKKLSHKTFLTRNNLSS